MKKRNQLQLLLLPLLLLMMHVAYGQNLQQLQAGIKNAPTDSQKTKAYVNLVHYYKDISPDSAYFYAEKGLKEFSAEKNLWGEAQMNEMLGKMDQMLGRLDLGKQRMSYALTLYTKLNKPSGVAAMNNCLGSLEATMGNYDSAMVHLVKAMKLYDSIKTDLSGSMVTGMNIGSLYFQNDDTANAAKYFAQAEAASRKLPVSDLTISLYNYIGVLHAIRGENDKALQYFKENVQISDKPAFVISHVECLTYLGNFYSEMHDNKTAMEYLDRGLEVATKNKLIEGQADILIQMASILAKTDPAKAMQLTNRAKVISDNMSNKMLKLDVCRQIAELYDLTGNYKEEVAALKQYQLMKDSLFHVNKMKEIASLGAVYELEKSNIKIDQISKQRNATITISILLIAALGTLVVFYLNTRKLNVKLVKHEAELIELSNTKNKLFSIIGHDLRWPVARIPTILEIIDDDTLEETERRYLIDSLREHTKATVETLDKLLYWGQSLMKGLQTVPEAFHSKQYIQQAIELRKIAAIDKTITVTDHTPDDLEIYMDTNHFDFIIRNLFGNAIKFTAPKGTIDFYADEQQKPGYVVFAIKDNGVGIDEARLLKIFEPFNSKIGTANEKGTGIGLMLCKEFAVKNGGDIWADSVPGKGSTFYISVRKNPTV